ncbi:hypothetical protein RT717_19440 [Imperialibacter roseus]|uniref:Phage holin family protein n=1 Tax=Imperialibacter roseus TaxID=1324217 RepID=A0ABZ0INW1_9BACT|nr:hypothetical protein [Imperialibacter roseus]WOK05257.1 hypothetical protein RT717_19440 [Imperialibacter roseus]
MKATAQEVVDKLGWINNVLRYVWLGLFLLMALAIFFIYSRIGWSKEIIRLMAVIAATFSYPIYTLGFKLIASLIGNILYIVLVSWVLSTLWKEFPAIVYMLSPIIAWVQIASAYAGARMIVKYFR